MITDFRWAGPPGSGARPPDPIKQVDVQVDGVLSNVDEGRLASVQQERARRRNEREGGHENLITLPQARPSSSADIKSACVHDVVSNAAARIVAVTKHLLRSSRERPSPRNVPSGNHQYGSQGIASRRYSSSRPSNTARLNRMACSMPRLDALSHHIRARHRDEPCRWDSQPHPAAPRV